MMNSKLAILFIVIIATVAWFSFRPEKSLKLSEPTSASNDNTAVNTKDYTIKGFALTQFDPQGKLSLAVNAEQAVIHQDTGELTKAVVVSQTPSSQWQLTAEQAVTDNRFNTLTLKQNILLTRDNRVNGNSDIESVNRAPQSNPLNIKTEQLTYHTVDKTLTSKTQVEYRDGSLLLTGIGIHASLITEEFQLLSQVEGSRYDH